MPRRTKESDFYMRDLRLLHDLAVFHHAISRDRVPAQERLERELGVDLARALCSSLADSAAKAA
jgi:hypothetical protein